MQTNKMKKRTASLFLAFLLLCPAILGVQVLAQGGSSSQIEDILDAAAEVPQEDSDGNIESDDSDAVKGRNAVVEYLRNNISTLDDDPTISGGYQLIKDARKAAGLSYEFEVAWKEGFKKEARALGVPFNSVHDPLGAITNDISTVEDAAVKINILTWNNTEISNGNGISNNARGMVSELLQNFENSGFLDAFTGPIRSIAIALAIAFGCAGMVTLTMDRNVTGEAISREFIKLILGVWFIYNFKYFSLAIIRIGTMVLSELQLSISTSEDESVKYAIATSLLTLLKTGNIANLPESVLRGVWLWASGVGSSMAGGIGAVSDFLGSGIVELASSLAVYSVIIELGVRYGFTPIAIADLYSEKFRSTGFIWLKKLFACALSGAVMYMVIYVSNEFKTALGASYDLITNMAINLTMIGMLFRARQIANDIVGAH